MADRLELHAREIVIVVLRLGGKPVAMGQWLLKDGGWKQISASGNSEVRGDWMRMFRNILEERQVSTFLQSLIHAQPPTPNLAHSLISLSMTHF